MENFGPLYAQCVLLLCQNARTRCLVVESIHWRKEMAARERTEDSLDHASTITPSIW